MRATTGSLFHVPVAVGADLASAVEQARAAGVRVIAADVGGGDFLAARDVLAEPTAWLFGNEARGLDDEALALADLSLRLPIYGPPSRSTSRRPPACASTRPRSRSAPRAERLAFRPCYGSVKARGSTGSAVAARP